MLLIVSPHLDDAVLGCGDHALAWRREGHEVRVLTLFTAAGACVSPVVGGPDFDAHGHMARRRREDAAALASAGLRAEHLGLVDAGFRGSDGVAHFQDLAQLLCGSAGPGGEALVAEAQAALRHAARGAERVLCPLAVGGHVDHVITRLACEAAVDAARLAHYADMPYARAPWRWSRTQAAQALAARRTWRWTSPAKRQALAHYASQMPLLFRRTPLRFPELVLWPHGAR